jgi:hypothetical protein
MIFYPFFSITYTAAFDMHSLRERRSHMNTTIAIRLYFLFALFLCVMAWGLCRATEEEISKEQKRQATQVEHLLGCANF